MDLLSSKQVLTPDKNSGIVRVLSPTVADGFIGNLPEFNGIGFLLVLLVLLHVDELVSECHSTALHLKEHKSIIADVSNIK